MNINVSGHYIVLTFKEWTNWVEYGILRKQNIKEYDGTQDSFNNLLDTSPDITCLEDNEFIFAKISDDYYKYRYKNDYLGLEVVQAFYAVSQRGRRLLEHTADKMQVTLNVCEEIEKQWNDWCERQKDILLNKKAISFFTILFSDEITKVNELNEKIERIKKLNSDNCNFIKYLDIFKSSHVGKRCPETLDKEFYNKKSYGGIATRFFIKNILCIEDCEIEKFYDNAEKIQEFRKIADRFLEINSYYSKQKDIQISVELVKQFLDYKIICEKIILEEFIKDEMNEDIPLLALSVYLHYEMLIENEREINLKSLKFDLKYLQKNYADIAELIVFLLGKNTALPYTFVSSLLYAQKLSLFQCVNHNYFEEIKYKLPSYDEPVLDEFSEQVDEQLGYYQQQIREQLNQDVAKENEENVVTESKANEDVSQNLIGINDENQVQSQLNAIQEEQQLNDTFSIESKDADVEENIKNDELSLVDVALPVSNNFDFFQESESKSVTIINQIWKYIEQGEIDKDSNWSDLLKKLNKKGGKQELINELLEIGVFNGINLNSHLKTIFDAFKEIVEKHK